MRSRCPELALLALTTTLALSACEREERRFSEPVSASAASNPVAQSDLQPGVPTPPPAAGRPYEYNAYAISEGKRLYEWFNCVGCHAQGGGNIGPPLMDDQWVYGSEPANVFATIVEGRPNGMPSFRGRIPEQQVWQLVAYVRSMSGQIPKDAAPGRSDDMYTRRPEMSTPHQATRPSALPPSSER